MRSKLYHRPPHSTPHPPRTAVSSLLHITQDLLAGIHTVVVPIEEASPRTSPADWCRHSPGAHVRSFRKKVSRANERNEAIQASMACFGLTSDKLRLGAKARAFAQASCSVSHVRSPQVRPHLLPQLSQYYCRPATLAADEARTPAGALALDSRKDEGLRVESGGVE
jgi:hypothetical protein